MIPVVISSNDISDDSNGSSSDATTDGANDIVGKLGRLL
uniref:Uncharacterized protein n=1 Tax=Setaria digitata TaxID=48799 RepID=A0A915PYF8_9BILA